MPVVHYYYGFSCMTIIIAGLLCKGIYWNYAWIRDFISIISTIDYRYAIAIWVLVNCVVYILENIVFDISIRISAGFKNNDDYYID